jgi:uncharacterized membrane protein
MRDKEKNESPFKKLIGYFFQGIPIAVTIYIIIALFDFIDSKIPTGLDTPGMGILILVATLILVGFLANTFISSSIAGYLNRLLKRAPIINTIYTTVKDLVSAFTGSKKKFDQPVSVKISKDSNLEKLGFVTREDLKFLGIEGNKVAVYFPHSYAWSGNLFIVDKENVRPLSIPASEMMKLIISGGVSSLEDKDKD